MGLEGQVPPHGCFQDRVDRANEFVDEERPPYDVYIDGWDDTFEQRYRAWPDKYYFVDANKKIIATSTYGQRRDALIDYDCLHLLQDICA